MARGVAILDCVGPLFFSSSLASIRSAGVSKFSKSYCILCRQEARLLPACIPCKLYAECNINLTYYEPLRNLPVSSILRAALSSPEPRHWRYDELSWMPILTRVINEHRRATTNIRDHGGNNGFKELQVQPLDVKTPSCPPALPARIHELTRS